MPDVIASQKPTVFFLPGLGLSGRVFDEVASLVGETFDAVAIDLPGFGGAPVDGGVTVDDLVRFVIRRIRRESPTRWLLAGHSMGGKIASLVAARTLAGEPGLFGLAGVVLLAGSPPTPEPMDEERREAMLSWVADGPMSVDSAREFVEGNVGAPLDPASDALVMGDLALASPEAWTAWLERGSRDDRADEVGVLDLPALIVAGGSDGDLGADAQRELNGPVYPRAAFATLDGAGHLLTLERPREVADEILRFWTTRAALGPEAPADVCRTIASGQTNRRTRSILAGRYLADDPDYRPRVLTDAQLATLRAIAARAVPQEGEATIDLAARCDARLANGLSDGWRNAAMPADDIAMRRALDALADFGDLSEEEQDQRLTDIVDGSWEPKATGGADALTAKQFNLWFEDCRVDLVRIWLGHPATMARIGFDGFANGGDLVRIQGFLKLGADEREGWEPEMPAHGSEMPAHGPQMPQMGTAR